MTGKPPTWNSGQALYRLDHHDDGSGDLYAEFPDGHEDLVISLNPRGVREFRERFADARLRPGEN
jgi:hypothetical protein